jgi:RNA polymerase sigma factor (sigma-70 family)
MSVVLKTYLENETAIKRYLRRFLARSEDIDDLAQETFIRAFSAEAVETVRFPKALLFKIARNLALNEHAKLANATTDALEDFPDPAVLEDVNQKRIDDQVDARRQIRALAEAVASLPPQCSRAFVLRKIHGLSYKEIAVNLEISVSTAEKHVALGLLRCGETLRRQGYEVAGRNVDGDGSKVQGTAAARSKHVASLDAKRRDLTRDE